MEIHIPWDADDEEVATLRIIRERVPNTLIDPLFDWVVNELGGDYLPTELIHEVEGALRVKLPDSDNRPDSFASEVLALGGQKLFLRLVDLLLSWRSGGNPPERLMRLLDLNASALTIEMREERWRLANRTVEGVDHAHAAAVSAGSGSAGSYLSRAVLESHALDADPSRVMTNAIRAVEASAAPVVIPRDSRPTLGKVVAALKAKQNWSLILDARDDGRPDHRDVVIGMLETLAFAQRDRHVGNEPTHEQAAAHVQLAAVLVAWFAAGAIVIEE